jgi:hypothetical protein
MRLGLALWGVLVAFAAHAAPPPDEEIEVPSGQRVVLQDVIWGEPGPEGLTVRFRFIAPEISAIGGSITFDEAIEDMDFLCNTYALPRVQTGTGPTPSQIIVSFAEQAVEFGVITDATQFIESYAIGTGECVWEAF